MTSIMYRFKHHMLADTNIHMVSGCKEHPDVKMPHAHYTHHKWLEWVDNLTWRIKQQRLRKLLKHSDGLWMADYDSPTQNKTNDGGRNE